MYPAGFFFCTACGVDRSTCDPYNCPKNDGHMHRFRIQAKPRKDFTFESPFKCDLCELPLPEEPELYVCPGHKLGGWCFTLTSEGYAEHCPVKGWYVRPSAAINDRLRSFIRKLNDDKPNPTGSALSRELYIYSTQEDSLGQNLSSHIDIAKKRVKLVNREDGFNGHEGLVVADEPDVDGFWQVRFDEPVQGRFEKTQVGWFLPEHLEVLDAPK